jgi:hypothetical protein
VSTVFVIVNEWTSVDNSTGCEVVDCKYFESEQDAWVALRDIAVAYDVDLHPDDTNFVLEDHKQYLQYEEYYILELNRG